METNQEQGQQVNYSEPQKKKKSRKGLYIVLVILGIIITGGFFLNKYLIEKDIEVAGEASYDFTTSIFSIAEYDNIPSNYQMYIHNFLEQNDYLDGTYFLTKIPDRAKLVYAFGDFTDDDNDEDDMAVLFEKNDYQSSMLVIFNHKGEVLFVKHEYDLPVINSFKSGAKIYENEAKLTPASCGGLIIKTAYRKEALIYDKKTKKFNSHYQYTEDDIKSMNEPEEYYDEGYEDGPVDDTPEEATFSTNETESSN